LAEVYGEVKINKEGEEEAEEELLLKFQNQKL
jgi:hypothetical protein